jgi:hypothetical protein
VLFDVFSLVTGRALACVCPCAAVAAASDVTHFNATYFPLTRTETSWLHVPYVSMWCIAYVLETDDFVA